MGEKVLLELELLCLQLCLQFIPEELRSLLVPGRDFGYGFVALFFGGFARSFNGTLEELSSQLSWARWGVVGRRRGRRVLCGVAGVHGYVFPVFAAGAIIGMNTKPVFSLVACRATDWGYWVPVA